MILRDISVFTQARRIIYMYIPELYIYIDKYVAYWEVMTDGLHVYGARLITLFCYPRSLVIDYSIGVHTCIICCSKFYILIIWCSCSIVYFEEFSSTSTSRKLQCRGVVGCGYRQYFELSDDWTGEPHQNIIASWLVFTEDCLLRCRVPCCLRFQLSC